MTNHCMSSHSLMPSPVCASGKATTVPLGAVQRPRTAQHAATSAPRVDAESKVPALPEPRAPLALGCGDGDAPMLKGAAAASGPSQG